ncbi:MAG: hypothetical protein ABSG75_07235 [Syntrophales bacterium]|jgi:hypothetical protein
MGIINLEDIRVGMVLAGDIKERSGRILLAGGNEITEKHLRVFKMWGITEADIKDVEKEEIAASIVARLDPSLFHDVQTRMRERFCLADMEHPFVEELFRLVTIRQVRHKSKG